MRGPSSGKLVQGEMQTDKWRERYESRSAAALSASSSAAAAATVPCAESAASSRELVMEVTITPSLMRCRCGYTLRKEKFALVSSSGTRKHEP